MKKYLIMMMSSFLLADLAGSITPAQAAEAGSTEMVREVIMRGINIRIEALARALEHCNTTRIIVPLPEWDYLAKAERTADTTISIEWSGGCVEGKRDGDGVLTIISERNNEPDKKRIRSVSEGRFIKGQQLGLWCLETKTDTLQDGKRAGGVGFDSCSILAGHGKLLTKYYRKQLDGRWMENVFGLAAQTDTATSLAPGVLEAQSAKMLADAAAGKQGLKVDIVGQSKSLDDLVPGSKIMLVPSSTPVSLKNKRVGVVLSSRTIIELERFTREREALIAQSSRLTGTAAQFRAQFIAASSPDRLLINVAKTLSKHGGTVLPADDLVGLQKGQFDYVLVIDWRHMTRFDLLGKYDSVPAYASWPRLDPSKQRDAPTCESLGSFLISPDLKAVKQMSATQNCYFRNESEQGDSGYMTKLAVYFESQWGKGQDNIGNSMSGLDWMLAR